MSTHPLIQMLRAEVRSSSLSGWLKACYIVVLIDREDMTPQQVSLAVDVPGFSTPVVQQYLDAVDLAVEAGVLPPRCDITTATRPPDDNFDAYYTGIGRDTRYQSIPGREAIVRLAEDEGVGASKALDIAKNPRALGIAFRGSDKAQEAILGAMEHVPDTLLQRLAVRAYAVLTDRQDAGHRIRMAHLREVSEPDALIHRIHPDHAVVVNGSVFVFGTAYEAERFQTAYQNVHGHPAMRLTDVTVSRDEAWDSLREFREAQVGRPLENSEWQDYIDNLV